MKRVLIADDHAPVRVGVAALLAASNDLQVVGAACDGREALALAAALNPDVVLMDLSMPVVDGVEAIRRLASRPQPPCVVALTGWPRLASRAIEAGAARCVFKDASPGDILAALLDAT